MKNQSDEFIERVLSGEIDETVGRPDAEHPEAQDCLALSPLIRTLDKRRSSATGLSPAALDRSWSRIEARITAESPRSSWNGRLALAWAGAMLRRHPALASATVLAGIFVFALYYRVEPAGRLLFAEGSVTLRADVSRALNEGILDLRIDPGTDLTVGEAGGAIARHGENSQVSLAQATEVRFVDRRELNVETGEIWIESSRNDTPFTVRSPELRIDARDATFGVTRRGVTTRVQVAEGTVSVRREGDDLASALEIAAGQVALLVGDAGSIEVTPGVGDAPAWVSMLREKAEAASVGTLVPSVTTQDPP